MPMSARALRLGCAFLVIACSALAAQALMLSANPNTKGSLRLPTTKPFSAITDFRVEGQIEKLVQENTWRGLVAVDGFFQLRLTPNAYVVYQGFTNEYIQLPLGSMTHFRFVVQRDTTAGRITVELWDEQSGAYQQGSCPIARPGPLNMQNSIFTVGSMYDTNSPTLSYGFLRWYSSTRPLAGAPPSPARPDRYGDLVDYEFDSGTLQDYSGNKVNFAFTSGTIAFGTKDKLPPAIGLALPPTMRAGSTAVLDASSSFSNAGGPLTVTWQQLKVPEYGLLTAAQTMRPVFAPPVFGTYYLRVTVTDAEGQKSSKDFKIGAVATDEKGVVIVPDPPGGCPNGIPGCVDKIIGPMLMHGSNPWTWFDDRARTWMDALAKSVPVRWPAWWRDALPGTVTVAPNGKQVTGTGTTFTTTFCQGPDNPNTPKSMWGMNPIIVFHYRDERPGMDGKIGYQRYQIASCQDDTHLTLTGSYNANRKTGYSDNIQYSIYDFDKAYNFRFGGSGDYGNYYDNVLALYAMYYRTGIDDYLNAARDLADAWFEFPYFDRGNYFRQLDGVAFLGENRLFELLGIMLRAMDGRPDYWPALRMVWQSEQNNFQPYVPGSDSREQGYFTAFLGACSYLEPTDAWYAANFPGSGLTSYSSACYNSVLFMKNYFEMNMTTEPDGSAVLLHEGGIYTSSSSNNNSMVQLTNGSTTVTQVGGGTMDFRKLMPVNSVKKGAVTSIENQWPGCWAGCTAHGLATGDQATIVGGTGEWAGLNGTWTITKVDDTHFSIPVDSSGFTTNASGLYYFPADWFEVAYTTDFGKIRNYWAFWAKNKTTAIHYSDGDTDIYRFKVIDGNTLQLEDPYAGCPGGTGASCTKYWSIGAHGGLGQQPFMWGLTGSGAEFARLAALRQKDAGTADMFGKLSYDNAVWQMKYAFWPQTGGMYYQNRYYDCLRWLAGDPKWQGSAAWCGSGDAINGDKFYHRIDWAEATRTFNAGFIWKDYKDDALKALGDQLYSLQYSKPGFASPYAGDGGYVGNLDGAGVDATGVFTPGNVHGGTKWSGFYFGFGGGYTWPAARLGGVSAPLPRTISIPFRPTEVRNANGVRVTVIQPNGGRSQVTCTESPCSVQVDARQGNHLIQMDYVSNGRVVADGKKTVLAVE